MNQALSAQYDVGDARRYVEGRGTYVSDLASRLRSAAVYVIRSEIAHARIHSVDLRAVRAADGVLGAFSAADVMADLGSVPVIEPRISSAPELLPYLQPVLATERVRYVGEPLALIVARDRYLAEDAAALIELNLEPLSPALEMPDVVAAAPLFEGSSNEVATLYAGFGNVSDAFASSDVVVSLELSVGRHTGVPMETRGLVVDVHSSGALDIYGATKVVHTNRRVLAQMMKIDPSLLRLRELDVGGAFGIRGEFYPEDFLVPWAAKELGIGVAWVEDRREHLVAANHSREQLHTASIAASAEGRFLALRTDCLVDSGAYVRTVGLRVAELTIGDLPGPYRFNAYAGTAHCVVTNRTPTGTYRSPGRFESSFVRERLVEALAGELGISAHELRLRNLVSPADMPYNTGLRSAGKVVAFRTGDYPSLYQRVVDRTRELAASVIFADHPRRRVGQATACFVEKSGLGPFECARIVIGSGGEVSVFTGASYLGQGLEQSLVNVVSSRLRVSKPAVKIMRGDTDMLGDGIGTYASRSTVMAGSAVAGACDELLVRAQQRAADLLGGPVEVLVPADGGLRCGDRVITWSEIAAGGLEASYRFEKDDVSYGFGTHGAVVEVDTRTGLVKVLHLVLGYDVGNAIDEAMVVAQLEGGAMQAIGGAITEKLSYDENGNPTSTTLMDYLVPTASEAPRMHVLLAHSIPDDNPLGARGAGEAGVPAIAAAVARAVEVACGSGPCLTATPIRPERVLGLARIEMS